MTKKKTGRLLFPESNLARLLDRAHGRTRAEAVRDGTLRLEGQRGAVMAELERLIAALEDSAMRREDLPQIWRDADRTVTLALAFGLLPLADAARRLCDTIALFTARGGCDAATLGIHVQALRLFAPDSPLVSDAEAALVLGRIAALATHLSRR